MQSIETRKPMFMHPVLVTMLIWICCYFAYCLRLSSRLWIPFERLTQVGIAIAIGMLAGWAASHVLPLKRKSTIKIDVPSGSLLRRGWAIFGFLNFLLLLEFAYCGYVPLFSMMRGAGVSHFAFGIPSLHGFVFAGYLFFSSCGMIAFLIYKNPVYLIPTFAAVVVGFIVVSRKMFMVSSLQAFVLLLMLTQQRLKSLSVTAVMAVVIMVFFGIAGDLRSGSVIDEDAGFNENGIVQAIPGADWTYMYVTTPLHNLSYAAMYAEPEYNVFPVRTLSPLLPSVIRAESSGGADQFNRASRSRYWLESAMFNVSTAFLPAYLDWGLLGIVAYAFATALVVSSFYYCVSSSTGVVMLATLYAANVLTVFSDNFVNLNVAGQILWLGLLAASCRIRLTFGNNVSLPTRKVVPGKV